MGFRELLLAATAVLLSLPQAMADEASLAGDVAKLTERLDAQEQRLQTLEAELAETSSRAAQTRSALERELAQPMLLLVGTGPCPHGFKRIVTRVLILTRARNAENGSLFDQAGLMYEDPPGVGDNVYRDLDFCFRPANAIGIE